MTEKKLRVLHVVVQPILVYDDGVELYAGPAVQPITVRLSELPTIDAEIMRAIETQPQPTSPT